jgi:dTDP-4-dehydrorhamnose reductase/dTDP-4-dehydrorhamnose 3,5-epimerase-like enzyme
METIPFDIIHSWWGGKVKVRKLKPFEDSRGLLMEILRSDSDTFKSVINMYISETNPLVKRGPHEHNFQDDEFITWNSRMVYEFYNPETKETKFFVTEPRGIYSLYVEHGIHHGYRNLELNKISYTFNGLNKLYKGFGRNDPADEIRHEKNTTNNKILFIFGAGGKLGKALTEVAYKEVGMHTYEVIPCFDKILNEDEFRNFTKLMDLNFKDRDVTFINCAALTNTQESSELNDKWRWTNIRLPLLFAGLCSERNWNFIQISTNYVYHKVKPNIINYHTSTYTRSKQDMEFVLTLSSNIQTTRTTTLLRVANLYGANDNNPDIFKRFSQIIKETGKIAVDPNEYVSPTEVSELSLQIINMFKNNEFKTDSIQKINIVSEGFKLDDFVTKFYNITPELTVSKIDGGYKEFISDPTAKIIKI